MDSMAMDASSERLDRGSPMRRAYARSTGLWQLDSRRRRPKVRPGVNDYV